MPTRARRFLLLSPSILVPCLTHDGIKVWDTLAIAEYLNEIRPKAGLLPADREARAHCRAICGEMHSGFANLRSALPMNLKRAFPGPQGLGARAGRHRARHRDLARMPRDLRRPVPVRRSATMADAMYAPVVTRFVTYDVKLDRELRGLLRSASWRCRRCTNGSPPRSSSPRRSTNSTWSSERPGSGHPAHAVTSRASARAPRTGPGVDELKSAGPDDLQIFHVGRVVEQVVHDARALMNAVAGRDQRLLVLVHEARPALQHDHDMEIGTMAVPAGAFFGCIVGIDQLREHLAGGRVGDSQIAIQEEIAESFPFEISVSGFDIKVGPSCSAWCCAPLRLGLPTISRERSSTSTLNSASACSGAFRRSHHDGAGAPKRGAISRRRMT